MVVEHASCASLVPIKRPHPCIGLHSTITLALKQQTAETTHLAVSANHNLGRLQTHGHSKRWPQCSSTSSLHSANLHARIVVLDTVTWLNRMQITHGGKQAGAR